MISNSTPVYSQTPDKQPTNFNYSIAPENIKPEITIITPFYNTGQLFEQTVLCVLSQSFQNFEWLIIDDRSNDQTSLDILTALTEKEPRVKVLYNNENLGPGGSRNVGITSAKGRFLFFVDSDDLLEPTAIEKFWIFLKINTNFSFCSSWHIGFGAQNYLWQKGFEHGKLMLESNVIQPTFMARRSLFDLVRFDENIKDGFEDWDFWLKCASVGQWGYSIHEFLFWYRRSENIQSKWKDWDMGERMTKFSEQLRTRYHQGFQYHFPDPQITGFSRGIDAGKPVFDDKNSNPLAKNEKKRLLLIIPWMALGGADKFNLDLVKGLTRKDWEITVVATQSSDNAWYPEFSKYTADIFILNHYSKEAFYTQIFEHLIGSRNPDCILISNSELGHYLSPYIKYNFPHIPLLDYNHMEEDYWNNGGHPKQSVIYQPLFDRNIVSSKHLKQWMAHHGADKEKIDVVYTSSDHSSLKKDHSIRLAMREKLNIEEDTCLIVFCGRLTHQKQPHILLNTILEISKKNKEGYLLVIAGDGPESASMKKWIASHKLEKKILMLGALSHKDNLELLQAGDIFFLPSLWEGISLAIYEAMTLELPVVSADIGGQKELVRPGCGFLVSRSNAENEVTQYAYILNTLIDQPEKRKSLGSKSRQVIEEEFGIEMMVNGMNSILRNSTVATPTFQPAQFNQMLRQNYALLFFERNLAEQLWHSNISLQSGITPLVNTPATHLHTGSPNPNPDGSWYALNYEILPMWYKRIGHVLKILTGKRDWRGIFSSKYKPNPHLLSHAEWYAQEYDALPGWYKKFGKYLKEKIEKKKILV